MHSHDSARQPLFAPFLTLPRSGRPRQCSIPYFVVSNMSKIRSASLMTPSPTTYARAALNKIGKPPTPSSACAVSLPPASRPCRLRRVPAACVASLPPALRPCRPRCFSNPDSHPSGRVFVSHTGYAASVVPYWPHALQHFVLTHLPHFIAARIVLGHHQGIRTRALRKKAKAQ